MLRPHSFFAPERDFSRVPAQQLRKSGAAISAASCNPGNYTMDAMELRKSLSKTVLSLDDDVEVCALLEHLLWPHRVIGVAHAYVALELLAREAFDLFILDVCLPEMDGLELCRWIRREDPNAPIAICSGSASPADRHEAMCAGASAYYAKPFDPEDFQAAIEDLLCAAENRNREAEALVRDMLKVEAPARQAALAAMGEDEDEASAAASLQRSLYMRFMEAGGTRAHFMRTWPDMLEKSLIAAPAARAIVPAFGRHGG
jgi:DNA-binding response OmpR family regulator